MTDLSVHHVEDQHAGKAATTQRVQRKMAPIVPAQNIAGRALVLVIA
ncbi:MAG: ABC transporter permease, partial [Mesorhizobium sp.]